MHISLFLRQIYFFFLIFFIFNSVSLLAQSFRATPLNHPDGTFVAEAINNNGQIAGTVSDSIGFSHALRRDADGQFASLTELGSNISVAYGMNESGHVIGKTLDEFFSWHTVVWEENNFRELDPIENAFSVFPVDINDAGGVTGRFLDSTFFSHAVVWGASGTVQNLPELDGISSEPSAINENGEIVGTIFLENGWSRAILWQPDDNGYIAIDLGTLGGLGALATDINNNSQIVGYSFLEEGFNVHAFFWENNEMINLGTLGGDNSRAISINDDAFIVGASQDSLTGKTKSKYGTDLKRWQEYIKKLNLGNKHDETHLNLISQLGADDQAVYTSMRRNREQEYITPRWRTFTLNDNIDDEINDVSALNLSRAAIGLNADTGQQYLIISNEIQYILPETMEQGIPGLSYAPYETPNDALFDNFQIVSRHKLFAPPGSIFAALTTPPEKKVFLNTYSGSGVTLQHRLPGSSLSITDIVVASRSSLTFARGGVGSLEADRVNVSGNLSSDSHIDFKIAETFTLDGVNAFAKGHFITGLTAKISLNLGYIGGMVLTNNPGFETDLIGRNNAAPGTGVIEGGSRFSSIPAILCRSVSSATGENGGYAFPVSVPDKFKYTPVYVILNEDPIEPVNVVIKADSPDAEPKLNINNIIEDNVLYNAIVARYGIKTESGKGNNKTTSQQIFTATFRVAVDSIDLSEDPNLFRLLQFDFDGEYIGVAGTFVPPSGSPPTTAIFTGFIDSMLNVTHRDVTITDSVILVLASGDVQTGLPGESETGAITTFELAQNFPNPFNPETVIQYQIPQNSKVRIIVYNVLGQPVRTLVNGDRSTGVYNQKWNMLNDNGQAVSSGIYVYLIGANVTTVKVI